METPRYIVLKPSVYNALIEAADALAELADLVEDAHKGEYEIDSFTTQPARRALRALTGPASTQHVTFTESELVWRSRKLDVPLDTDAEKAYNENVAEMRTSGR